MLTDELTLLLVDVNCNVYDSPESKYMLSAEHFPSSVLHNILLLESVRVRVCECTPAALTVVLKLQPISAGTLDIPKSSILKT